MEPDDLLLEGEDLAAEDEEPADDAALAFSPRAILGGFALLAALIVLLLRRRGGKSSGR